MKLANRNICLLILMLILSLTKLAKAECFVDSDLECNYPYGRADETDTIWTPKSARARAALYSSAEVQDSEAGCNLFVRILRYECAPIQPIQAVFRDPVSKASYSVFAVGGGEEIWLNRLKLPKIFQDYLTYDTITNAKLNNITAIKRLGESWAKKLIDFLSFKNGTSQLTVPSACTVGASVSICGVEATCIAKKDPRVGDYISIVKAGSLANVGGQIHTSWCSESETLDLFVGAIQRLYQQDKAASENFIALDAISSKTQSLPNFAAFGKMPLLNQVDPWVQGLALDKYGDDGKKVIRPGICLPSANAMMALALRSEAPGSTLGNRFDNLSPVSILNVRANSTDPSKTTQLQYDHYAGHIDEMLRAGGLVSRGQGQPFRLRDFNNFFYRNKALVNPSEKTQDELTEIKYRLIGNYKIFFDDDYRSSKPIQDQVKSHLHEWIANKTGVTLSLQSTASQPPQGSPQDVVSHANTVRAYSGSTITVNDPWRVASTLKFSQFQFSDAGKVVDTVNDPEYASCIQNLKTTCEQNAEQTIENLKTLISPANKGTVTYNGTVWKSGQPLPTKEQITDACLKKGCRKSIDIIRPKGKYEMLTHVGADPEYVKSGGKKTDVGYVGSMSLEGQKTAAYIKGYLTADPWPTYMTINDYRSLFSDTSSTTPTQAASCTALTQGVINVNGKAYLFRNPIPVVSSNLRKVESTTPIEVGCVDLHSKNDDGSPDPQRTDLFGTMFITCSKNVLTVTKNLCLKNAEPISCPVANGNGKIFPTVNLKGLSYSLTPPGNGPCRIQSCNVGFVYDPVSNSCNCSFNDAISGKRLAGTVTGAGQCIFNSASNCPVGTVLNGASDRSKPACVVPDQPIDSYDWNATNKRNLYRDNHDRRLADFADPQSIYAFNQNGRVQWKGCKDPRYEPKTNATGDPVCVLSSLFIQARDQTLKLSQGKKADGSCTNGFLMDYEKKFCVASLASCNYGINAYGMMTFDSTAPEQCRFMGCYQGITPLKYNLDGLTHYVCTLDNSLQVNSSNSGIERIINGNREPVVIDDHIPINTIKETDLASPTYTRNLSTDLDCSKEADSRYRAACQSLAMDIHSYVGLGITADRIKSWTIDRAVPLTTFNCGGPDSLVQEDGSCVANWSSKQSLLGQCVIPNGKGKFEIGKGCLVDSCLPGFVPNPSNTVCLDTSRPCFRPDLVPGAGTAYLAQTFDNDAQCLIGSCSAGFQFADYYAPWVTISGVIVQSRYSDFCLPNSTTSYSQQLTPASFNEAIRTARRSWYPGSTCGETLGNDTEGRYDSAGICRITKCGMGFSPVHAPDTGQIIGCQQYRQSGTYLTYSFRNDSFSGLGSNFKMYVPGFSGDLPAPICLASAPFFSLNRDVLTRVGFSAYDSSTYLANASPGASPTSLGLACGSPSVNKITYELLGATGIVLGVGSGDFTATAAKLELCSLSDMFLTGNKIACTHAPIFEESPLMIDGGYIVRNTPNNELRQDSKELYDLIEKRSIGTFEGDISSVSGYVPSREKADLTYNLSYGASPLPAKHPLIICASGQHVQGTSCVSDTESCGSVLNGTYQRQWLGSRFGDCAIRCNTGFHLEGASCLIGG